MLSRKNPYRSRKSYTSELYSLVFGSKIAFAAIFILIGSFLLQPFHQVLANEVEGEQTETEPPVAEDVREQAPPTSASEPEEVAESVAEPESAVSDETSKTRQDEPETIKFDTGQPTEEASVSAETNEVTNLDQESNASTSTENSSNLAPEFEVSSSTPVSDTQVTTATSAATTTTTTADVKEPDTATSTASSTSDSTASTTSTSSSAHVESGAGSPNPIDSDQQSSGVVDQPQQGPVEIVDVPIEESEALDEFEELNTIASTTEQLPDTIIQAQSMVNEQNFYQFSRQSCVAVGDGTYHCTSNAETDIDSSSVVYADNGVGGDLEIFLRTSRGEVREITANDFDDSSPHYDAKSRQVVWQRLIDGRHQIILYDIEAGEETQLTFSRTNNMEPKVSDEGIVWQAWDGNDWEIMYFDGTYTEQITDNVAQDVAPVIEDGYILWSVLGRDEQEARVYSLADGEILTITGHEGGTIANPRFVLVYDTKFENGDVVTKGFDPLTGLSAPIAARPAPEPIDIPTPDPIGEIRALIQNKSFDEDEFELDGLPDNSESFDLNLASTSKATSSDTLNLKAPQFERATTGDEVSAAATTTKQSDFELTDFDLVLTPTSTNDATEQSDNVASTTASSTQP